MTAAAEESRRTPSLLHLIRGEGRDDTGFETRIWAVRGSVIGRVMPVSERKRLVFSAVFPASRVFLGAASARGIVDDWIDHHVVVWLGEKAGFFARGGGETHAV